ncbi:Arginyl-tRNA synthetase (EC 6.1.1.19) [uncultured Gammaproteobacteria bacterium]|uniref:Arginine--tRNA ligase n=2 Tax=sulfur-oxidizing symbionts TaxID=32036 RepID=A0A1H6K412_9GAMM|nr:MULTISPECIES: arginine--tRNA ligase [sulfur-oxidizing symbionts]CAC5818561.1 Arginyl-tRNA synthetase (EC 6.1.1.19) [uncultured Gammaproteobacteria bacterium]CAB5496960.1 Arginyl-tRNA synthetase (EC [Bathymodiolus thermophilus thioautotrophic gill symbiont]CAC9478501.1 Arginyl-tRNA synthetase (EC 6.1.1.19) [uncultured Gammaproteobacteria bacterium]CAC9489921.1 Arginyl-tRNA synthetase (EC 6.1.1.19) [uncultured Gammaproteobacteria bacterium]CAC9508748.1 Arginyl-tRNA synthetase (EC 6.1.1.19) [u
MNKEQLQVLLMESLVSLKAKGVLENIPENIRLDHSKDKTQGDFASNIAMMLSKQAGCAPRELALMIIANFPDSAEVKKIEIAGPGFINFFMSQGSNALVLENIIKQGKNYGLSDVGAGQRVLLEFVSANPTGPLHVGHGRGAAYGATVANLLRGVGFEVDNEYYVNDAGRQMDILATSVYLRYVETQQFPDNGYKGDYIFDIAKTIKGIEKFDIFNGACKDEKDGGDKEKHIDDLIANCKSQLGHDYKKIFDLAIDSILGDIKIDLAEFGVQYQQWFSEQSLVNSGLSKKTVKKLQDSGHIVEKEGALWFKTTDFGDDLDRVVVRDNGMHTYFASDIAYHLEKFERGYDKIINIWGADHHGYIARVKASIQALGYNPDKLEILLVQFVNLIRKGEKVSMSTRSGSFITLEELRDEVGNDVARFFYILRKADQHMDFDLDLAKSKTNENPVFYIQYAHARICSVLAKADGNQVPDLALLDNEYEQALIKQLSRYADTLKNAALNYEPHVLAYYLRDLAGDFHSYYNNSEFLIDNKTLQASRLQLVIAVQQILQNGLGLLGVSAPEKM